ncbi:hypothetical protein GDO81_027219 [Engystomops pustulosus]|uniref:Ig-like domain-containing protein n=1 Tax=Engystomops pustulosus TaxID=76066 RepID=A0AAV6YEQ8_ENGPU|nr:hypothetical protein GDO81_027219 [Engystomops pustulosus]
MSMGRSSPPLIVSPYCAVTGQKDDERLLSFTRGFLPFTSIDWNRSLTRSIFPAAIMALDRATMSGVLFLHTVCSSWLTLSSGYFSCASFTQNSTSWISASASILFWP